jgi:hypothetical protein
MSSQVEAIDTEAPDAEVFSQVAVRQAAAVIAQTVYQDQLAAQGIRERLRPVARQAQPI